MFIKTFARLYYLNTKDRYVPLIITEKGNRITLMIFFKFKIFFSSRLKIIYLYSTLLKHNQRINNSHRNSYRN